MLYNALWGTGKDRFLLTSQPLPLCCVVVSPIARHRFARLACLLAWPIACRCADSHACLLACHCGEGQRLLQSLLQPGEVRSCPVLEAWLDLLLVSFFTVFRAMVVVAGRDGGGGDCGGGGGSGNGSRRRRRR